MVVLIDTNVILDYLLERQPQFTDSTRVLKLCRAQQLKGFVAFHSVSIIWYTLRKEYKSERRKLLSGMTEIFTVTSANLPQKF